MGASLEVGKPSVLSAELREPSPLLAAMGAGWRVLITRTLDLCRHITNRLSCFTCQLRGAHDQYKGLFYSTSSPFPEFTIPLTVPHALRIGNISVGIAENPVKGKSCDGGV